ncbi:Mini-ribonuclease 3 [Schleiferilactobacillus shenzhenensis]|uniref:Mini-ribonuclease 3 n=1 Tax=Schleiferilactobacillus shenzhenensis LY-73 TaxID=1231336 RepID=U4TS52_9LACO|nr:ribonuclease III domain-containing protein [Schleiferilactobacillus shenzhenensis]ERL66275.1 MrnC [Schleiferilactobacillus shenzhenensis LY-73]
MIDDKSMNGIDLAYLGDAVYEVYIREYLLGQGIRQPAALQRRATQFVSAKAQAKLTALMEEGAVLDTEEQDAFRRGRNAKSYTHAKNTSVLTYRISTGFEAIFGFLQANERTERIKELAHWCIDQVEKGNTHD